MKLKINSRNAVRRVLYDSPRIADDDRRERCNIMTVKELYFANNGWLSDTKIKVLGKREGVLYEGVFIDMPDKIVNSRVVVFNDRTIVV